MSASTSLPRAARPPVGPVPWALAGLCCALVILAFSPVLTNGFFEIFDDGPYIAQNGYVRQGLTWEGLRWALRLPGDGESYWRPLTFVSLMADVQLFGARPGAMHAVNLGIHLASALLLFAALARMTGRPWRAATVAVLFAIHPLQVESVAWTIERGTVLAAAFAIGAILAYARYVETPSARRYAGTFALFAASVLTKPMMVTLPFLLLLLDVWPLGRTRWVEPERPSPTRQAASLGRLVLEKAPFIVVALAIALGNAYRHASAQASLGDRLAMALTGYWAYVAKVVWPSSLAVFYPLVDAIPAWHALAATLALAGVTAALAVARGRISAGPLVGWLWFLGTLVPMAGFVRAGLWARMSDRFAYVPMIGLFLIVAWAGAAALERTPWLRRAAPVLLAIVVCALAARTHAQARRWADPVALLRDALELSGPNRVLSTNLGQALQQQGRVDEARAVYEEMIRTMPDFPEGFVNLGSLLHAQGELGLAEAAYHDAIAVDSRCGEAHFNLGLLQKRRGDWPGAVASFERAAEFGLKSRSDRALGQLGQGYAALGRRADAERAFREALQANPLEWRTAAQLALLLAGAGRTGEAERLLDDARRRSIAAGQDPRGLDDVLASIRRSGGAPR